MENIQQIILEKRLEGEFEQLVNEIVEQYLLDESTDITIRKNYDFRSELLRVKLKLIDFFNGKIPFPQNLNQMCDPKKHSFYIHFHNLKRHVAEIRISGHYPTQRIGYDISKIINKKYNYLFVDYSKFVNEKNYADIVKLIIQGAKPQQVDYAYINQMPNTSVNILVLNIINIILKYLTTNKMVQAVNGKMGITWTVTQN